MKKLIFSLSIIASIFTGCTSSDDETVTPIITPASGTITGNGIISQALVDSTTNGFAYANIHNSSFSGGELRGQLGNQVLPVKLSYFNGYKERSNINLVWQSAQEIDLKQYEVEQQHPATKQWITKATVKAIGSSIRQDYRMVDAPVTAVDNFVFYRLKAIDKNGSFSYSPTVRINFNQATASLNILSNPVTKGMLRYNISGLTNDKKVEVSIIDYNGRLMYKTVQPGLSTNDINVSSLGAGMYKLIIKAEDIQLQQSFLK